MKNENNCYLVKNKLTGRSYFVDKNRKRISDKFDILSVSSYTPYISEMTVRLKSGLRTKFVYILKEENIQILGHTIISLGDSRYCIKSKNEPKCGIYDASGRLLTDYYEDLELSDYGYAQVKKHDKWGIIDDELEWICEPKYDEAPNFNEYGFKVYYDQKTMKRTATVENITGDVVCEIKNCTSIDFLTENLIMVYSSGLGNAVVDLEGNTVIKRRAHISYKYGYFLVRDYDLYGLYSKTGEQILDLEYRRIYKDGDYLIAERYAKEKIPINQDK